MSVIEGLQDALRLLRDEVEGLARRLGDVESQVSELRQNVRTTNESGTAKPTSVATPPTKTTSPPATSSAKTESPTASTPSSPARGKTTTS